MNNTGRKRVRRARKNESIKRILLTICMMAMVAALSIGGTLAWLTDESTDVINTFTTSDIDISLKETPVDAEGKKNGDLTEGQNNSYRLIPGVEYDKDPTVAVETTTDVDVYLFVEHIETNNLFGDDDAKKLVYTTKFAADGWLQNEDLPSNVWYRIVGADDTTKSWELITGNKIVVNENLTKDITNDSAEMPSIEFNAYAIQVAGFEDDVVGAWTEIAPLNTGD